MMIGQISQGYPAIAVSFQLPEMPSFESDIMVSVYLVTIRWQGELRRVGVIAMGKRPLIGRALLAGQYLGIRFEEGAELRVEL